jgi:hypothetical protein
VCGVVLQVMWATVSIIGMLFMQPTDPQKANPRTVVQLQQFSWTEGGLQEAIKVGKVQSGRHLASASLAEAAIVWHNFLRASHTLPCCEPS